MNLQTTWIRPPAPTSSPRPEMGLGGFLPYRWIRRIGPLGGLAVLWLAAGSGWGYAWSLSGGVGREEDGALSVTGEGEGSQSWRSEPLDLQCGGLYRMQFRLKSSPGATGSAITGMAVCNRDIGLGNSQWQGFDSVFVTPANLAPDQVRLRFGHWQGKGTVWFDSIRLHEASPVYRRFDSGLELGDGERIQGNRYEFIAPFLGRSANHARGLVSSTCGFNSNRWTLYGETEIVYRHHIGRRILAASVSPTIGYHRAGELVVETGADGTTWTELGRFGEVTGETFEVPAALLPADELWVRMRSVPTRADKPPLLQLYGYRVETTIEGAPENATGNTHFVSVLRNEAGPAVRLTGLGEALPGGRNLLSLALGTRKAQVLDVVVTVNDTSTVHTVDRAPGLTTIQVPYVLPDAGRHRVNVRVETLGFEAETVLDVPALHAVSYGARLPGSSKDVAVWGCESGWKISRTRPPPGRESPALVIRAARNEMDAAQLVVRPRDGLQGLTVTASDLRGPGGATLPANQVDILEVQYVPVSRPTDHRGAIGEWPDPLPPLTGPMDIDPDRNQPFWIRIKPPREAAAGIYTGTISLRGDGYSATVPLELEVFDFSLPDRMTCVSAFGFDPGLVWQYQRVTDPDQRRQVLGKYLRNLADHHISPYNPAPLDPIRTTWSRQDTTPTASLDTRAWDRAMTEAMETYHFNSFRLTIPGMGGGTFHARSEPRLLGYAETDPRYEVAFKSYLDVLTGHLRDKGWLDEAFVYWFDEPDPKDYEFVMNGFARLRRHAPDLTRMLTEQVEDALIGGPNLWCPVSHHFDPERANERMAAGDQFWWYVCTGPKSPYATLFIDHPATNLRVWLWQTWQRGISGILIWQSNYWTSTAAYPDPRQPQNPYRDPMGWTSGYSTPAGTRRPWGNGDGRFIYPPVAAADGHPQRPVLDGPVDSIRWEMLRDGIEDYEYLVILQRLLDTSDRTGLLSVPESIARSKTEFTHDPAPIEARRLEIARAIERLGHPDERRP